MHACLDFDTHNNSRMKVGRRRKVVLCGAKTFVFLKRRLDLGFLTLDVLTEKCRKSEKSELTVI